MHSRSEFATVLFTTLFLGCNPVNLDCLFGCPSPPGPPGPCSDVCSPEGSAECDGNRAVQTCQRAANGCLAPVYSQCASAAQLCIGTACATAPVVWEAMTVPSVTGGLSGMWGYSGNDVFAVGEGIIHYDGMAWSTQASGMSANQYLSDVWGSSSTDVFAVGNGGTILHYDGAEWTPQVSGTSKDLRAVWGSSSSDVFVAADELILHYDGIAWSTMFAAAPGMSFLALWGDSPSTIFAVGFGIPDPPVYRYDGAAWNPMDRKFLGSSLWGSSPVDVYAVDGYGPGAYHYDGHSWSHQYPVTPQRTYGAVSGTSASNVFMVGEGGSVSHYDGSAWEAQNSGTDYDLVDVWVASTTDVFILGVSMTFEGTVLRYKP